jgi:hypothetical protein
MGGHAAAAAKPLEQYSIRGIPTGRLAAQVSPETLDSQGDIPGWPTPIRGTVIIFTPFAHLELDISSKSPSWCKAEEAVD